ncbi:MAG: rhomboid family intramembrane serine protease [Candidatus Marinimicrobia bacterium]|jgi:membrane associated rhomboid family serine protease|nr:rhomboid family intramembrane serine protease [Candidatus Neomarinimicrobiota bacterium]MBT4055192.1 rhomboid family intramembrane serine protease [Candidatus Neomarinimicrobiota bacterium]MBT4370539.1 rhomboid family intramembrane serine protease [Candidatus Neomarinimicrobiota bacterium]MBT4662080.1 rhomboid family intramembrane serine protease [Candidatus Neomarinimicrobiota bacterium]MBT4828377.1 rhomboid family intramembrane serine protease [Candidatus Neomarinimicrobiota bacterium]
MFFPYKDDNPRVLFPFVTFGIIILNVLIFLGQFWISSNDPDIGKSLVYMYGFVPAEFNPLTIFTSMFMHGGFAHIIGNMWFLYIFGDNVESILGHVKYFMFYLACGIGAALAQFFVEPASQVPMIGASGAVAGVLGAYMIRFPKARVHVLAVIIIFITTFVVPAQIVLGLWFLMQLSGGLGSLGVDTTGGVAWFAHIGGFIIGVTSLKYFQNFRIE